MAIDGQILGVLWQDFLAFLIVIGFAMAGEHFTVGQWIKNELLRRSIGGGSIFLLAWIMLPIDQETLAIVVIGFTAAAAVLGVIESVEREIGRKKEEAEKKRKADLIRAEIQKVVDVQAPDR